MEEQKPNLWKNALNWGVILGVVLIIYDLLMYFLDLKLETWTDWLKYLIMLGVLIFATKSFRDNVLNGTMSYGKALGFGILVSLFASILSAIYNYVFMAFIDPEFVVKIQEMAEEQMIQRGMPDEQIEMAVEVQKKILTPIVMSLMLIPVITFVGFIISLITSIFLQKKGKDIPFE